MRDFELRRAGDGWSEIFLGRVGCSSGRDKGWQRSKKRRVLQERNPERVESCTGHNVGMTSADRVFPCASQMLSINTKIINSRFDLPTTLAQ
jgi:hypothetical protein